MADSIIRRHVHSRDGYIALLEFNVLDLNFVSSHARQMDIRVMWDDDQVIWHSAPYSSADSHVTADDEDDPITPKKHQMFKMLVRQSECRYVLNFEILEHHSLRYVVVARAELPLESLSLNPGQKSLSLPVHKVTEAYQLKSSKSALDDSTLKSTSQSLVGVRFGTLYLNVVTKPQDQVYRWFWQSLLHHIHYSPTLPSRLQQPIAESSRSPPRSPRSGLLGSGEFSLEESGDFEALRSSSPPPFESGHLNANLTSSSPPPSFDGLPAPLTASGHMPLLSLSAENLKDMILLLGIETSDEEFEDMCAFLNLERPTAGKSPARARRVVEVLPEPDTHPTVSMDDFMSHLLNVAPRRPPGPHRSDLPLELEEVVESFSPVPALFLGSQLDHDAYIWETALVNDGIRITHLVVGQHVRPSAQLLQTADASNYDVSPSTSPPSSSSSTASTSSIASSSTLSTSPTNTWSRSVYGFLTRFSGNQIRERRKDVIFVQDRETGKVVEEKMPEYLRRMLRGMYSNPTGRRLVNRGMSKALLKRLTFNQAKKYTAPSSVSEIPHFVHFHNIDTSEIVDPIESFTSFNEFFIRKLKAGARPISSPDDPAWAISPADCRLHVYESITDAQKLWIKGKTFNLHTLLGDDQLEADFAGCSLVIARLAPQDYHRFHYPVSGFSGKYFSQGDAYYTVNPIAIRENVDVYSLNKRTSVVVESPHFGRVMIICVGATMVGSVVLTSGENVYVEKGDELGYFQFGGSTLLVLFQRGRIRFDDDLVFNSAKQQETLVKMGTSLGRATRPAASTTSSFSA